MARPLLLLTIAADSDSTLAPTIYLLTYLLNTAMEGHGFSGLSLYL